VQAVGVDACRAGWVAVVLDDGLVTATRLAATLEEIVTACPEAEAIGVDMPLGLVERGWREADQLGAARLGRHRSRLQPAGVGPAGEAAPGQRPVRRPAAPAVRGSPGDIVRRAQRRNPGRGEQEDLERPDGQAGAAR
jgi:hypothetical protein